MNKIISSILSIMLIACTNPNEAKIVETPSQMPPIVFIESVDYKKVEDHYLVPYAVGFFDNKGNYCTIPNQHYSDKFIKDYIDGKFDKDIVFHQKVDESEIFDIYKKLYEVSKNNNLKIISNKYHPHVESPSITYYGFYYDKNNEIKSIRLLENNTTSNDERVNDIYIYGTTKS